MKRFLKLLPCIALAVLLACIALHPTEAQAASVEDLTYTITNGEVTITEGDRYIAGELVIPETIEGCPVTTIGFTAFYERTYLTSVIIPDSVTTIGDSAFYECTDLTSVNIPNSVTTIDDFTFAGCVRLTSVTIPNSVTSIGRSAFARCKGLTDVIIPDSVTSIGEWAFGSCTGLTSVTIPDSVTAIGRSAFSECYGLTDVYYTGTQEQWEAINIGTNNDFFLNATIHFASPCEGSHAYDDDTDATCNKCGYTKLTADAISLDAANKLVVIDGEAANINHRAVIYFLGDATVEDITDEAALKVLDPNAKTIWGLTAINKRQLLDNGNYVVLLHYNECNGAKQTVAKAFAVTFVKPTLAVNGYKVTATAGSDACVNYRATVYNLGDGSVGDITDEAALQNAAVEVKTLWRLQRINKLQLLKSGNYVILLHYNVGTGAKQTIAKEVTIDLSQITLEVNDGKLVAEDPTNSYSGHRAVVYYLGDQTVENIYDEAALKAIDPDANTYWQMTRINKVQLTQPGNYVVLLHYNLEGSAKLTLAVQVTI